VAHRFDDDGEGGCLVPEHLELNAAICAYLKNYPGQNVDQFEDVFGDRAGELRTRVREILTETTKIDLDWNGLTLSDGGNAVQAIMAERRPDLSAAALSALGNYYTYLAK
jgi:hypothetical protein